MRSGDVLLAIPQLVFALLAVAGAGTAGWVLVLVIGIAHAPRVARVIRSATAGVVAEDYVLASRIAVPQWKILRPRHHTNIMGPLMVEVGLRLTYSIGAVASLSFLGLGMQPPARTGALMINENRIAAPQPWGCSCRHRDRWCDRGHANAGRRAATASAGGVLAPPRRGRLMRRSEHNARTGMRDTTVPRARHRGHRDHRPHWILGYRRTDPGRRQLHPAPGRTSRSLASPDRQDHRRAPR
ncbi:ABC transporter permease subunit [Kocuria rhizophila]|nr:ABC transporter permease subunit [Kocuria rhizophila]